MASGCSSVATCTSRIRTSASVGTGDDDVVGEDGVLVAGLVVSVGSGGGVPWHAEEATAVATSASAHRLTPLRSTHLTMVRTSGFSRGPEGISVPSTRSGGGSD